MNDITIRDVVVWAIAVFLALSVIGGIVMISGQIVSCNRESNKLDATYKLLHPTPIPPAYPGCYDEIIRMEGKDTNMHWNCERGATATYIPFPPPAGAYVCHCGKAEGMVVSEDAGVDGGAE